MKEEIAAAVFFVARLVKRYGCLDNDSRERFAAALTSVLFENYKNHWHPSAPTKGQAYRSVNTFFHRATLQIISSRFSVKMIVSLLPFKNVCKFLYEF